jgi:putative nucleotidyltransferase with HDIG domain
MSSESIYDKPVPLENTPPSAETARILVVDDEPTVCDLLDKSLTGDGYEVVTAGSTSEALEALRQERANLVLADLNMPGRNGLELLQEARILDPELEVVMVTGVVDIEVALGALRAGASDYILKPFNLEQVQHVVRRTLEKQRLIQENQKYQHQLEERVERRAQEVLRKKQQIEGLYAALEDSYECTLKALITALDFKDRETQGHSWRVVEYSALVATRLGITGDEQTGIRWGALLHDVGKIGIPDGVLHKKDKLTEDEWREMRRHPEIGYRMLQHIEFLEPALEIVLSHHERWDGKGYPRGLSGDEIPLGARIFAVVDTFDAMTTDRPYRSAQSIRAAYQEIERCVGSQFDPYVADAYLNVPEESWVEIQERVAREIVALEDQIRRVLP